MADSSKFMIAEAQMVLDAARQVKSEKVKHLGEPIQLSGKALGIEIIDGKAWIAENTAVARKLDLETGKTLQIFKGHMGPVTTLAFCDKVFGSGDRKILITGSWDQTIKLWDTDTKELISTTAAHEDFLKSLFVIPALQLLISGSSDKIVRIWDLSTATKPGPLTCVGSISSHTRPVECLFAQDASSPGESSKAILYTADTMGVVKIWDMSKGEGGDANWWRTTLREELNHHRTRINEMIYGNSQLWTASSDETVQVLPDPDVSNTAPKKPPPPLTHPLAVRAILPLSLTPLAEPYVLTGSGDIIRIYDVSSPEDPELISQIDGHWHDVTALRLWIRKTTKKVQDGGDGKTRVEPWIVSTGLDGTIRKWRLSELLTPPPPVPPPSATAPTTIEPPKKAEKKEFEMTEEEERELAELLGSDEE